MTLLLIIVSLAVLFSLFAAPSTAAVLPAVPDRLRRHYQELVATVAAHQHCAKKWKVEADCSGVTFRNNCASLWYLSDQQFGKKRWALAHEFWLVDYEIRMGEDDIKILLTAAGLDPALADSVGPEEPMEGTLP